MDAEKRGNINQYCVNHELTLSLESKVWSSQSEKIKFDLRLTTIDY